MVTINFWLTDENFLENKIRYSDKEYLGVLFGKIDSYLKQHCPCLVLLTFDTVNNKIYMRVGQNSTHNLEINNEIASFDFIYLMNKELRKYFPQYEYFNYFERKPTTDEIVKNIENGITTFDDAYNCLIKDKEIEKGVIEKIYLGDDKFELNINGERFLRYTTIPLSEFMYTIKRLGKNDEKRGYIFENSKEITMLFDTDITLSTDVYKGNVLLNFFRIRLQDMKKEKLTQRMDGYYRWGRFRIKFESDEMKKQVEQILKSEVF